MFSFSPKDTSKGTYGVNSGQYKLHHTENHLLSTDYDEATVVSITKDKGETTLPFAENKSICPWASRLLGEMPPSTLKVPKWRPNDEIFLI